MRLRDYIARRDYVLLSVAVAFIIVACYSYMLIPGTISALTERVGSGSSDMGQVYPLVACMMAYAVIWFVFNVSAFVLCGKVAADVSYNIRRAVFRKVMSFTDRDASRFGHTSLITRTTNDVALIEPLIGLIFPSLFQAVFALLFAFIMLWGMEWMWVIVVAAVVESIVCMFLLIVTLAAPRYDSIQKALDRTTGVINENVAGIRSIRAFGAEEHRSGVFRRRNKRLFDEGVAVSRVVSVMEPYTTAMLSMMTLFVYVVAAILMTSADLVDRTSLFYGAVVVSTYGAIIIQNAICIVILVMRVPRISASVSRVSEILDLESSASDGDSVPSAGMGTLEVRGVYFRYPGSSNDALQGVSFTVRRGEILAVVGGTGSGKTTLVNLIARLDFPTGGSIFYNGTDLRALNPVVYHRLIGLATQKPVIFKGTVDHNVRFGELETCCTRDDLEDALVISRSDEFVDKMERGVDSVLSSGGTNLSGGQRQRLSIARSVVDRPEIYILDDSFSALDCKTEAEIRDAISGGRSDGTVIIVTQKVSTAMVADRIVCLDAGRVVGIGTHRELMDSCEEYRRVAILQGAGS